MFTTASEARLRPRFFYWLARGFLYICRYEQVTWNRCLHSRNEAHLLPVEELLPRHLPLKTSKNIFFSFFFFFAVYSNFPINFFFRDASSYGVRSSSKPVISSAGFLIRFCACLCVRVRVRVCFFILFYWFIMILLKYFRHFNFILQLVANFLSLPLLLGFVLFLIYLL